MSFWLIEETLRFALLLFLIFYGTHIYDSPSHYAFDAKRHSNLEHLLWTTYIVKNRSPSLLVIAFSLSLL